MRAYLIVRDDYTLYDKSFQIGEYVTFEKTFPAPALDSPIRAMKFFWKAPQLIENRNHDYFAGHDRFERMIEVSVHVPYQIVSGKVYMRHCTVVREVNYHEVVGVGANPWEERLYITHVLPADAPFPYMEEAAYHEPNTTITALRYIRKCTKERLFDFLRPVGTYGERGLPAGYEALRAIARRGFEDVNEELYALGTDMSRALQMEFSTKEDADAIFETYYREHQWPNLLEAKLRRGDADTFQQWREQRQLTEMRWWDMVVAELGGDTELDILVQSHDLAVLKRVFNRGREGDAEIIRNNIGIEKAMLVFGEECPEHLLPTTYELSRMRNKSALALTALCGHDEHLDVLVHNQSPRVRECVTLRGRDKDLDILREDESTGVRREVAKWCRREDIEVLKDDPCPVVRQLALHTIYQER